MLRKIPIQDLRLGMRVERLEGSWLKHDFWRSRFTIDSPALLAQVQASGVAACWVAEPTADAAAPADDSSRASTDHEIAAPESGRDAGDAVAGTPIVEAPPSALPAAGCELEEELGRAADVCRRGREAVISMFQEARMGRAIEVEGCLPLVDEIAASIERQPGALLTLARLKTQDDYTYMHSMAVCALMVALGRQVGLDAQACRAAGLAGLMHDIGKALMPLEVLNKPDRLTDAEYAVMRTHPERGHALLAGGAAAEATLDVVLHHHERIDGTGYPHRLAGAQISQLARMGAICDVYDAITSNRPYKTGWDPAKSLSRMASWRGHFDETLFAAFVRSLGIYPNGSLVRLSSGRGAVVVDQHPRQLLQPVVLVLESDALGQPRPGERIELAAPGCSERIVAREPREGAHGETRAIDALWLDPALTERVRGA
jgi:HD-GYP domain-containing protein (c-di-GMP phosphodiesterase class II)